MNDINRNFSSSNEYSEKSFIGIFHEQNEWDDNEYFKLEEAIYIEARNLANETNIPKDIAWPIIKIYSYLMMSLGCQYDSNDGFEIKNITREQFIERRERLQFVFEGYFNGEMPNKEYLGY